MQHRILEHTLMGFGRHVAKGQKNGVARVVVLAVEVAQLLIAEVRNMFRVTAAVEVVGVGGKQLMA